VELGGTCSWEGLAVGRDLQLDGRKRREVQLFVDRIPFRYRSSRDKQVGGLRGLEA
jgi:hypothetical protein